MLVAAWRPAWQMMETMLQELMLINYFISRSWVFTGGNYSHPVEPLGFLFMLLIFY